MATGKVITLVPRAVSGDTVRALEFLLQEAKAGRLIGLAWVSMHPLSEFEVDIAGETKRSPSSTRGWLLKLDDELADMVEPR